MTKIWADLKAYFRPRKLTDCLRILRTESKEYVSIHVEVSQHLSGDVITEWRVYSHGAGAYIGKSFEEAMGKWRNRNKQQTESGKDVIV